MHDVYWGFTSAFSSQGLFLLGLFALN
jgi:hypothetical protein